MQKGDSGKINKFKTTLSMVNEETSQQCHKNLKKKKTNTNTKTLILQNNTKNYLWIMRLYFINQ